MINLYSALRVLLLSGLLFGSAEAKSPRSGTGASAPLNQRDTQVSTYETSDRGSDDSLRNSAVYAMQALMDLANTKLPSAMKNGYNAYGKFRNAEDLDRLKDHAAAQANNLGSVGSDPVLKVPAKTNTSFRRLNPSFLREGEAAKISAEFERQTGMKREDFLVQIADVSERKIRRSDPMMIDKALSNFESFLHKIPNAEFRKRAEKNIALVPDSMRRGIIAQTVQKFADFFASSGPNSGPSTVEASLLELNQPQASKPNENRAPSPASTLAEASPQASGKEGSKSEKENPRIPAAKGSAVMDGRGEEGIDRVVVAAIRSQTNSPVFASPSDGESPRNQDNSEPSIFQQVSSRYRTLTPQLLKTP